jgi:cytoskeletal protein RodZ
MSSIGDYLRAAREERKIPIAQVVRDTKISEKYIAAIESGQVSLLPAPAYAKGFLKIYAEYLGLDPKPVVEQYVQEHVGMVQQGFPPEGEFIAPVPSSSWRSAAVGVGVAIVLVVAIVSGLKFWRSCAAARARRPAVSTEELETLPLPPLPQLSPTVKTPAAAPTPQEGKPKQKKLEAKVEENVWMKVYGDGVLLFQGTVRKGKKEFWLAEESFDVRVGKPRQIKLFIDGKPVEDLKGKAARNVFIDKNGKVVFYKGKMRSE